MIKIAVDSNAECKQDEKYIDALVPIAVTVGEKQFLGGVNLERDEFYEMLINDKDFPTTSQPSPQTFTDLFEEAKNNRDDLILITISSALSGTYQSACIAKEMVGYERIFIIDSNTATYPMWILTKQAYKLREEGKSAEEIVETLEELKNRIRVIAAVDTLEFLYRGGRLNKATATIGTLTSLKPILTVNDEGKVVVYGKAIGKGKAMQFVLNKVKNAELDDNFPIYSLYSYGQDNCAELEEQLKKAGFNPKDRLQIGPSVGAHVGPGAYGVVFVTK